MTTRLAPEHRRNLQTETAISVVINTAISGLFAWGIFHSEDTVPLWSAHGIVVDLIPTIFMITLILTIALTRITRGRLRKGKLPRPEWRRADLGPVGWLPANVMLRAPVLAAGMTLVLVPLSAFLLMVIGIESMRFNTFFIFKLAYGAAFALLVTPVIMLRALADPA